MDPSWRHIIPPLQQKVISEGHCTDDCTKKSFPPQGISIFAVIMQTHNIGKEVKLRQVCVCLSVCSNTNILLRSFSFVLFFRFILEFNTYLLVHCNSTLLTLHCFSFYEYIFFALSYMAVYSDCIRTHTHTHVKTTTNNKRWKRKRSPCLSVFVLSPFHG